MYTFDDAQNLKQELSPYEYRPMDDNKNFLGSFRKENYFYFYY